MSEQHDDPVEHVLKYLARRCTEDLGKEVLPGDLYGILCFGWEYAEKRFTTEEFHDIIATLIKEQEK